MRWYRRQKILEKTIFTLFSWYSNSQCIQITTITIQSKLSCHQFRENLVWVLCCAWEVIVSKSGSGGRTTLGRTVVRYSSDPRYPCNVRTRLRHITAYTVKLSIRKDNCAAEHVLLAKYHCAKLEAEIVSWPGFSVPTKCNFTYSQSSEEPSVTLHHLLQSLW